MTLSQMKIFGYLYDRSDKVYYEVNCPDNYIDAAVVKKISAEKFFKQQVEAARQEGYWQAQQDMKKVLGIKE